MLVDMYNLPCKLRSIVAAAFLPSVCSRLLVLGFTIHPARLLWLRCQGIVKLQVFGLCCADRTAVNFLFVGEWHRGYAAALAASNVLKEPDFVRSDCGLCEDGEEN